jgi:hypothetical protein
VDSFCVSFLKTPSTLYCRQCTRTRWCTRPLTIGAIVQKHLWGMAPFAGRPSGRAPRAVVARMAVAFTGLLIIAVALHGSRSSAPLALVAIDSSSGMRGPVCA